MSVDGEDEAHADSAVYQLQEMLCTWRHDSLVVGSRRVLTTAIGIVSVAVEKNTVGVRGYAAHFLLVGQIGRVVHPVGDQ